MHALARIRQVVLRERLLEIVHPRCQVRVRVRLHVCVNIRRGRKLGWVTADVLRSRRLIYAHIVDAHDRWVSEQVEIDRAEGFGDTEIDDHIL